MRAADFSEHQLRMVAVVAECHPKTVARFLAGKPVRPLSAQRIKRALGRLKMTVEGLAA